ncbi:MAG: Lpg1974 family pore-forming outer membrane protein [Legionellales bacterium]|jgi:hypothetical protein
MKNISRKIFLGSLTSLSVMASSLAFAEEMVTAPSFEGGVTASIGTFYFVPSADNTNYVIVKDIDGNFTSFNYLDAQPDYDFGWEASLGYIFEDTANGIELSYRGLDTDTTATSYGINTSTSFEVIDLQDQLKYTFNSADLMISQYMDIGTHMQVRLSGGLAYLNLEEQQNLNVNNNETSDFVGSVDQKSKFNGWGPRLGMDARYDFGEDLAGFGIVGGASLAYFLGSTDLTANTASPAGIAPIANADDINYVSYTDNVNNQSVVNLRGNLGIDYVYFFDNEERSTLGLELGYMVDYYQDAVTTFSTAVLQENLVGITAPTRGTVITPTTDDVTFSGPYLQLKGAF